MAPPKRASLSLLLCSCSNTKSIVSELAYYTCTMRIREYLHAVILTTMYAPIFGFCFWPARLCRRNQHHPFHRSTLLATDKPVELTNKTLDAPKDVASKPTTKSKKKRTTIADPKSPTHWINATDTFLHQLEPSNDDSDASYHQSSPHRVQFTVRGQPMALKRHRSSRGGFLYNPSAKEQESFRNAVESLFHNITAPIFPLDDYLAISMVFSLKRPKKHYVGNKVEAKRLRPTAPLFVKTLPDVDNLAKFVLDSMNAFLFHDDRQVASLQVTKIYGEFPSTRVTVQRISSQGDPDWAMGGNEQDFIRFS